MKVKFYVSRCTFKLSICNLTFSVSGELVLFIPVFFTLMIDIYYLQAVTKEILVCFRNFLFELIS